MKKLEILVWIIYERESAVEKKVLEKNAGYPKLSGMSVSGVFFIKTAIISWPKIAGFQGYPFHISRGCH